MADILGINLSEITAKEALKKIAGFLAGSGQHYIVTPNPEIILEARRDKEFLNILNKADLALADGFGLQIAGRLTGQHLARVTGSDLTVELLPMAAREGIKTAILNWRDGLSTAEEIQSVLEKRFSGLKFIALDVERTPLLAAETISQINDFQPALLFSALGFPYQEKIIFHNLNRLPSVRVALGVGGSFDFLTGRAKRAPRLFQQLGLEWFWRLIQQPNRYRRIFRATFVFISQILKTKSAKRK
jgi:N-acetylglucosaminyldiphosphoundecaprenol N-acetyl-beta-D-mannosaminyltransferase